MSAFGHIRTGENRLDNKTLFFVGLVVAATGIISPPLALAAGLFFGLTCDHPYPRDTRNLSKFLLQASVVAMGFGMNLHEVVRAGTTGFLYTAVSIVFVLVVGLLAGKLLKVQAIPSFLITAGTAICGGSAIAAVAPIVEAGEQEIAVSLGTVFVLNSIALLIFPALGWTLHLTQQQFGLWSALAIHDTSSVVGAASRYGSIALVIATTVKLARALWIVPLSFGAAALRRSDQRVRWPWFIVLFCVATVISSCLPVFHRFFHSLSDLGKLGLTATLYLIGTGISRATLKQVGVRPLLQGVIVWAIIGCTSLWFIMRGIISF